MNAIRSKLHPTLTEPVRQAPASEVSPEPTDSVEVRSLQGTVALTQPLDSSHLRKKDRSLAAAGPGGLGTIGIIVAVFNVALLGAHVAEKLMQGGKKH